MADEPTTSGNPTAQPKGTGIISVVFNIFYAIGAGTLKLFFAVARFFNIRNIYHLEAQQALKKVSSEYGILHSIIVAKGDSITPEEHDAMNEIERLKTEVEKIRSYEEVWPYIHLIELQLLRLFDLKALKTHLIIVRNNLYLLKTEDKTRWETALAGFDNKPDNEIDQQLLQNTLYAVTAEIQEVRRLSYMTNDLKRSLMKRFFALTLVIGLLAWSFAYRIIYDPLVHYAVILGVLGGFFSRLLSIRDLEFKPAAFSLFALYTYIQPLLGGIGAIILYIILVSPVGPTVISEDTFYLSKQDSKRYVYERLRDAENNKWYQMVPLMKAGTSKHSYKSTSDKTGGQFNSKSNPNNQASNSASLTTPAVSNNVAESNPQEATDSATKFNVKQFAVQSAVQDTLTNPTSFVIAQYPKPSLFLVLAFLAGFSERWFLGTLDTIIGKKLQKKDEIQPAPDVQPKESKISKGESE